MSSAASCLKHPGGVYSYAHIIVIPWRAVANAQNLQGSLAANIPELSRAVSLYAHTVRHDVWHALAIVSNLLRPLDSSFPELSRVSCLYAYFVRLLAEA